MGNNKVPDFKNLLCRGQRMLSNNTSGRTLQLLNVIVPQSPPQPPPQEARSGRESIFLTQAALLTVEEKTQELWVTVPKNGDSDLLSDPAVPVELKRQLLTLSVPVVLHLLSEPRVLQAAPASDSPRKSDS